MKAGTVVKYVGPATNLVSPSDLFVIVAYVGETAILGKLDPNNGLDASTLMDNLTCDLCVRPAYIDLFEEVQDV